ncbi:MAG TPA: hypothetical protein EYO59_09160 [Chromatiaceae bacterium]|nr:hypothetical protein [Chromatiaceae bacterium]
MPLDNQKVHKQWPSDEIDPKLKGREWHLNCLYAMLARMQRFDLGVALGYVELADFNMRERFRKAPKEDSVIVLRKMKVHRRGNHTTTR